MEACIVWWQIVLFANFWTLNSLAGSASETKGSYQVLRLYPASEKQIHSIRRLQMKYHLDPWRQVSRHSTSGDYMVRPAHAQALRQELEDSKINFREVINDAERFIRENDPLHKMFRHKRSTRPQHFRHRFLDYDEILKFLRHVRSTAQGVRVHLGSLGVSFEGRLTPFIKISKGNETETPKDAIFVDGGVHSREWIAPAMALEIVYRLAFNEEQDPAVDDLLDRFDWIIVPLVNPDGYAFTFQMEIESRLWRKSRSTAYSDIPECVGVDLNRNFGFEWNDSPLYGGSSNPCSGTYSGPHSFSEPETRNLRDLLLSNKDAIKGYLTFHSFGQFFLYPWGFSSDVDIEDERDLIRVASAFAKTMQRKNYHYSVGGSAKVLYPAAGASDDYVRGTVGVKYAYTVELPPHESSSYGFLLPEEEVKTIVSDTWDGVKAFAFHLHKHVYTPRERYFLDMLLNIANNSLNLLENNTALNTENAS